MEQLFRRYRCWVEAEVLVTLLETLAEMAGRERSADMIESRKKLRHWPNFISFEASDINGRVMGLDGGYSA